MMELKAKKFWVSHVLAVSIAGLTGCASTGNEAQSASAAETDAEPSVESIIEGPRAKNGVTEPHPDDRLFKACVTDQPPPVFPRSSQGAAFRAIVDFKIDPQGKATGHCYRRVEGSIEMEEKALANRNDWKFDKMFAGEPRERVIVYRMD